MLLKDRKYKSGTGWCVWRWTDVGSEYITRLHVVKTPWFAVCAHWINKPDPEPYMHDHPVTFLSLFWRGAYEEWRETKVTPSYNSRVVSVLRRRYNFIRASDKHSIHWVSKGGAVTICFMGPKTQEWGFFTHLGKVFWKTYYAEQRKKKVTIPCADPINQDD